MFSLLLLETDTKLVQQLSELLDKKKYFFHHSACLEQAYIKLEKRTYDIVVCCHELPDGHSLELIDYLQHFAFQTKSMILAKGTTYHDRVAAYKKGVDDFLLKPFNLNEFWWRLHTLAHRRKMFERDALTLCDGVAMYPQESLLQVGNKKTYLPRKENQILTCLLQHRNRVVGRDELIRWVWQSGEFVPKSITLDVYIKRIRMHLGKHSDKLETIRGFGYRIGE